jgi:ribose 5-phosphate isomerase B
MSTIFLGADHAGFALKEKLKPFLKKTGFTIKDLTPKFIAGDDYPRIGEAVARKTARSTKHGARGILVCGSGVGVAIAANRVKGCRAVEGFTAAQVKLAREHNDANVLTLGGWHANQWKMKKLIRVFLSTKASTAKRHRRRVKQLH